ncbi:glycosyltransferase family 4 protein [Campylobacter hyointestinalis]|uniref:Glycosyl transferase family 1 n=1 Tax=Campylobacter hyointestinalis subsp. hyointestinalis TaxID=91352 RepID=A0A855N8K1_CAMHY|nr:glycosyltransferase family 4 protein [Campylobacter hyointestinalis]ANE32060.1 glycosyltransferase, family 1 [Campylobacter hyointestinalis subsp. hyointestinalis LMG 9260]KEA44432.1 glycosyl transferase family 1 [Campylobacter hyointestinalis subsp. hyointestinalis]PPB58487.1 glycosyl transferase family 1 [Campylobacter hyointestinalis subsp. hyointestinalis]PPB62894.1 glycosyl transferase family 1 [Campylobacter hyointestinalis subsp. hyointestinalis]PPB71340.1 glycosyl transferase family
MINILELESSLGFGGQEHRTMRLINALDESKFKVFYGLNRGSKSLEKPIKCRFVEFNLKKVYNVFAIIKICWFVKKNGIKIISTHSGKDGNIGSIVGKICGVKVVRTRHLQTPIKSPFSYNLSSKVVAVSNATKESLIRRGVKENLIEVIRTGVDTQKYTKNFKLNLKKELGLSEETVLIGIVAVLRAAKNHKLLVEAFSELNLPKTALVIIGDGPQKQNLENLIIGRNNIFMLGNKDNVSEFLGSLDIFVLPSNMEALGTAILEASSAGVACIGSRVGGIPEAIKDAQTGLLFENGNLESLKTSLKNLIENADLRAEFAKNGIKYVKDSFSTEVMAKKTQQIYEELVNED